MPTGEVKTKTGVTWMDEELGMLRFVYAPGSECSLADAIENVDAQVKLAGGKVRPILCDITKCKSVSKEARDHYGSTRAFSALALVGGSPIGNIIGNIFIAVYGSRQVPTKMFLREADAIGDALIRTVNQSACDLVGLPREELLAQPIDTLFEGLSAADLIEAGGVRDQERSCRIKGGKSVTVSFSAAVMRDKRGVPEGIVCVARDLTEAKRSEEERWRLGEAVQRQAIILEELSTPLIPITDEILVMPLIGTVDEQRSAQILDALLHGVIARRTRVAIIDITGVKTMEAAGIEGILQAVKAVRLVGAEVALTGIRPEVARLLVAQGHDLGAVRTFGSLQNGIVDAMKRVRGRASR